MVLHTSDRLSCKGERATLKLVSWNVNGIRAWLTNGGLKYLDAEQPDVMCFQVGTRIGVFETHSSIQELKCDTEKIPAEATPAGYKSFWLSGDTGRPNASTRKMSNALLQLATPA